MPESLFTGKKIRVAPKVINRGSICQCMVLFSKAACLRYTQRVLFVVAEALRGMLGFV